jgi:Ca2+-binding EF-hand superfamily protein
VLTWDFDKNGQLELPVVTKAALNRFKTLDPENAGRLDRVQLAPTAISNAEFAAADEDEDGRLNDDEYLTVVKARFKAADPESQGTITSAQLGTAAGQALLRSLQ